MASISKRILYVYEDDEACKTLLGQLDALQHEVTTVTSLGGALFTAATQRFDLIIMDRVSLDRMSLDACSKFRQMRPETPILVYSRPVQGFAAQQVSEAGGTRFVQKPDVKTLFSQVMGFVYTESGEP